ncbi:MAG: DUF2723 domain-containing protein [Chloroflexi bacterium]|nr:DUF2723 domain-containing protein [Chloroflexota bacterium]
MAVAKGIGLALVPFVISLAVYVSTSAPSISWRHQGADGGDLAAAVYTDGVPHPPGYPTYLLLGKIFLRLIPGPEPAYSLNFMSAFFAAATASIIYLTLMAPSPVSGTRRLAALVAALSFALSPLFWSQATITEVYTLNAFFAAFLTYLVKRAEFGSSAVLVPLAAFVLGLGFGNHHSLVLFAPGMILVMAAKGLRLRPAVGGLALFFLGLSVYLYLPWLARQNPPINWGNAQDWSGLWWLVSGTPYRHYFFSVPILYWPGRLAAGAALMGQQFQWLGVGLGVWGLVSLWARNRLWSFFTLSAFLLTLVYALTYNTTDSYIYLIPAFLVFSLWLGEGLHALLSLVPKPWGKGATAAALLVILPGLSWYSNYQQMNLRDDFEAWHYAEEAFDQVEPRALIVADGDAYIFSLWYFRYVHRRDSETSIVAKPLLQYPWYADSLKKEGIWIPEDRTDLEAALGEIAKQNLPFRPIYMTYRDETLAQRWSLTKTGPLYRLGEKRD